MMNDSIENLTILHISDLHRTPDSYISNEILLDSLEKEKEQYEKEGIPLPNLIIVSGDLIMGVRGDSDSELDDLQKQYDEAFEFLTELANIFLNGDKERIIIVPGNHDVSWYHSKKSMEPEDCEGDNEKKKTLKTKYFKGDPKIRWSWDSFQFYSIKNMNEYNNRFYYFSEFYKRFYDNNRIFSLESNQQYNIFDFPEHNIAIVCFNSCYMNDHCNVIGAINPVCICNASRELRTPKYKNRILLAVWHHNTKGLPNRMDYMDSSTLSKFLFEGYSLALHGHQHKTQVLYEQPLDNENKLILFSAGTLCAGGYEIPYGFTRQYNIINLDFNSNEISLYPRKTMDIMDGQMIIWQPLVEYHNPVASLCKKDQEKLEKLISFKIEEAISFISSNRYEEAKEILESISVDNEMKRRMLLECYIALSNYNSIIEKFNPPKTTQEIIVLLDALRETNNIPLLTQLLELDNIKNSLDVNVKEEYQKTLRWVEFYGKL